MKVRLFNYLRFNIRRLGKHFWTFSPFLKMRPGDFVPLPGMAVLCARFVAD